MIGRGIISPRGLATRPRIPAICLTCIMFPRAPDPTIMSIGLKDSSCSPFSISFFTSSVASDQISTSFCLLSPSVMIPLLNCFSTFSASASCFSKISFFVAGVLTSSTETVTPDFIAQWKQRSLRASRLVATVAFSNSRASCSTIPPISLLVTLVFTHGKSSGRAWLNRTRPAVVGM